METPKLKEDEIKILTFLSKNSDSYLNIFDISKQLKISYPTMLNKIEILERFSYIKVIQVGNNKVCLLNKDKNYNER